MHLYTMGASIVGNLITVWLAYKYCGRRFMILTGTAWAFISMAASAIGGTVAPNTQAAAVNFVAWSVVYSVLYGGFATSMTWPVTAEVVSSRLRVLSLSIATAADYLLACESRSPRVFANGRD